MKIVHHTAGPWIVEDHAPRRDGQHLLQVATPATLPDGGYPMLVCEVVPTADLDGTPEPEQQANARLIAAAPEFRIAAMLTDGLVGLLDDKCDAQEAGGDRCTECLGCLVWYAGWAARFALTKASEGQTPERERAFWTMGTLVDPDAADTRRSASREESDD